MKCITGNIRHLLLRTLALITMLMLLTSAVPALSGSLEESYQKAVTLQNQGDLISAAELYESLGQYNDSAMAAMYCRTLDAAENGLYSVASSGFTSLGFYKDSALLASYYSALASEAAEDYESAGDTLAPMIYFKDSMERVLSYPEKISARDYRKADALEKQGKLESAKAAFEALNDYADSKERAAGLEEKLQEQNQLKAEAKAEARYQDALKLENDSNYNKAVEVFKGLGNYKDSAERVLAVQEKMKAQTYAEADRLESAGEEQAAYDLFVSLGSYADSPDRAAAAKKKYTYKDGLKSIDKGNYEAAYSAFLSLGDYMDSADKAYALDVIHIADKTRKIGSGKLAFLFHDQWGYVNLDTNLVCEPKWQDIGSFNSLGLCKVQNAKGLIGMIGEDGSIVIPCSWIDISSFNNRGICTVVTSKRRNVLTDYLFGLYDTSGKELSAPVWLQIGNSVNTDYGNKYNDYELAMPVFDQDRILAMESQKAYTFLNSEGQPISGDRWESLYPFQENLAVAQDRKNHLYGFIDRDGNIIIKPQYRNAYSFSDGLAAVQDSSKRKYGFIDAGNNIIISMEYDEATSFYAYHRADVRKGKTWYVIDNRGTVQYFIDSRYREAKKRMESGEYEAAAQMFAAIEASDTAPNPEEMEKECRYLLADEELKNGHTDKALEVFNQLENYKDAATRVLRIHYDLAEKAIAAGVLDPALNEYALAGTYEDAAKKLSKYSIREAEKQLAKGNHELAVRYYRIAGDYAAADTKVKDLYYDLASEYLNNDREAEALELFALIRGYKDADEKAAKYHYAKAEAAASAGAVVSALEEYTLAGDYADAGLKRIELILRSGKTQYAIGTVVQLGNWQQRGDENPEPIDWYILELKDGKALLLSKYILGMRGYDPGKTKTAAWKSSAVRDYLGNNFYKKAFSKKEQSIIQATDLNYSYYNGKKLVSAVTRDRIFLLSAEEFKTLVENTDMSLGYPVESIRKDLPFSSVTYSWLLRDCNGVYASTVAMAKFENEEISKWPSKTSTHVENKTGIRPAVWIDLEQYYQYLTEQK